MVSEKRGCAAAELITDAVYMLLSAFIPRLRDPA